METVICYKITAFIVLISSPLFHLDFAGIMLYYTAPFLKGHSRVYVYDLDIVTTVAYREHVSHYISLGFPI